jgi:hypothetical protein
MRRNHEPRAVGDVVVRYTAEEMPSDAIVRLHRDTVEGVEEGLIDPVDAFRVMDQLLKITLLKIKALTA